VEGDRVAVGREGRIAIVELALRRQVDRVAPVDALQHDVEVAAVCLDEEEARAVRR
jgi:hypothetical protein